MKAVLLIISVLYCSISSLSAQSGDNIKYISVTGTAEIEVKPDELDLEIILREYGDRDIEPKVELPKIEEKFMTILLRNKISKDKVIFNNAAYDWYYWWRYRDEYHKRKHFVVKVDKETDLLKLIKELDFDGVESIRILSTTNNNLQELRKEVKIAAVKAAKEKAQYLLESIGESAGEVISIEELPEQDHYYHFRNSMVSNVQLSREGTPEELENIASIKLRYNIKAKFAIQ